MNERVSTPPITLLKSALVHHQQGRLDEAEHLYRQVLDHQPHQQDALRLLGVLCRQRGDLETSRKLLELALEIRPDCPETHHDLGLVWFELHRYPEALAAYQKAITLRFHFPEAHNNLGNAYHALQDLENAAASYQEAVSQQPGLAEVHFNLGLVEQDRRNDMAALSHYERALKILPEYPEALLNLGLVQSNLGHSAAAESNYLKALRLKPDYAEAWLNLGYVQQSQGRLSEAESSFRRVLALLPSNVPAHLNLSMVLENLGKTEEAEREARKAVSLAPDHPRAQSYLGALALKRNGLDEAIACSNRALDLDPNFIPAHVTVSQVLLIRNRLEEAAQRSETILDLDGANVSAHTCLGVIRTRQRRPWEALVALEKALRCNPNDSDAMINLAICELSLGRFISGWKHYEARWTTQLTFCVPRHFSQPRWRGENLEGRTLLLYGEQGFGDTIQFVRYAKLVAEGGARVLLECQPSLKNLLQTVAGVDRAFSYGETLPAFDLQAPLLSLPGIFQTTVKTIPWEVPYLCPPVTAAQKLPPVPGERFRVGLAWCGSRSQNDDQRPVPFRSLQPILEIEPIAFYSFQTRLAAEELQHVNSSSNMVDLSSTLADFSVSAAFIQQLDLVITIDTALAHLAGALGKRVWVLLPFAPDWRWTLEGEDNPWYPTMRVFRQTEFGNWSTPVGRVASELRTLVESRIR